MSLEINTDDFWKEIDKLVFDQRIEKKLMSKEITKLREQVAAQAAVIEALRAHLKVIAGLQLCADNLMSNSDIAAKALAIPTDSTQILDEVRRAEREKCAKVCEELRHPDGYSGENVDWCAGTDHCAAAIRAME